MTDRPLFDDEYLPEWLKAAGITHAGKAATGRLSSPPRATAKAGGVPWTKGVPGDTPKSALIPRVNLPWKVEGYRPGSPAVFSNVPWQAESAETNKRSSRPVMDSKPSEPAGTTDSMWDNIRLNAFGSLVSPGEEQAGSVPTPSVFESQTKPAPVPSTPESSSPADDWMSAFREETPAEDLSTLLFGESPADQEFVQKESALPGGFFAAQDEHDDLASPFDLPEHSPFDEPLSWEMPDSGSAAASAEANFIPELPVDDDLLDLFGSPAEAEGELTNLFGNIPLAPSVDDSSTAPPPVSSTVSSDDDWMSAFRDEALHAPEPESSFSPTAQPTLETWGDSKIADPTLPPDDLSDLFGEPLVSEQDMTNVFGEASAIDPNLAVWDETESTAETSQPAPGTGTGELPDWFKDTPEIEAQPGAETDLQSRNAALPDMPAEAATALPGEELPDFFAAFAEEPESSATAPTGVSWITNTNKLPDVPPKDEIFPEPEWMAHSESDLVSDYVPPEEWMGVRDADAAVPAEDLELPEWMQGVAPIEESLKPSGAPGALGNAPSPEDLAFDQLDWLDNVDFETVLATADQPQTGRSEAVQNPVGAPAASSSDGLSEFDLLDSSGLDIDELLNLPPSGELIPTGEAAEVIQEVDFDEVIDLPVVAAVPISELPPISPMGLSESDITPTPEVPVRSEGSLLATQPLPKAAPAAPTAPPQSPPVAPSGAAPLPEWVADMRSVDIPIVLRVGDQQIKITDKPLAELPDQLKLFREKSKGFAEKAAPESPAPTGPLSGITEAIFPAPAVSAGAIPASKGVESVVTPDQARRIQVLQNLLSVQDDILTNRIDPNSIVATPETLTLRKKALRSRFKLDRLLIAVILAAAVALPFFTNVLNLVPAPSLARLPAAIQADFNEIVGAVDGIQAGQGVVVALEYAPTGAGELNDLALMLLRDLIKHGAHPFLISTNPAGAMQSAWLMAKVAAEYPNAVYTLVGYLPGGALGVKGLAEAVNAPGYWRSFAFAADLNGKPLTLTDAEISALQNAPAFVLAETQEDVRTWIEQYRTATKPFRVALLTSASAGAAARAYADLPNAQGRLLGPLVSLRDALIYQELRGLFPDTQAAARGAQRWQSVSIGALASAAVLLLGVLIGLISGLRRRRA